ncbi:testis specific protein Y-linked [Trichomycterus rosablanca]|uniref:testis specific protein Y-linked n=1 Tax=Trichomycterus rosablanca TaxID=2290929 RepID=UPI002F3536F1
MSSTSDSGIKPSESNKRAASPQEQSDSPPSKQSKVDDQNDEQIDSCEHTEKDADGIKSKVPTGSDNNAAPEKSANGADSASEPDSCGERAVTDKDSAGGAAMAAAEVLASLTGGGNHDTETPCSSRQAIEENLADQWNRSDRPGLEQADSSSGAPRRGTVRVRQRVRARRAEEEEEEEEEDSLSLSSSTASSNDDDGEQRDDGECSIVAVQMAPELRRSVAMLAHVQMRLEALERKGARLHRRIELKLSRQKRPHHDQRASIALSIPGFWLTALLNHPHLSAQVDENDEDALSYMNNLEVETFKNNKLGYRISFHFRRNPFFQNKVIMKELHLGGSPVSFSNPILWHPGESLTGNAEPRRNSRGVYQSFFHWFNDHSNPGKDDIAQILKDDLYKNPLRYYLTPLWEPQENGSKPKPQQNSNGDECVIISDSDDDQEQEERDDKGDEDDIQISGSDESDQEAVESSNEGQEQVDIEEVEDSRGSGSCDDRKQDQEDDDIEVNEDEVEEEN